MEQKIFAPLRTPSTCQLVASSSGGKTQLLSKLLEYRHAVFQNPVPKKVLFCYVEKQPLYEKIKSIMKEDIIFHQGFPSKELLDKFSAQNEEGFFLCLDDLAQNQNDNEEMSNLFCIGSHHRRITILSTQQSLYPRGKFAKSISMNATYLFIFDTPRDKGQIAILASQLFPGRGSYFKDSFEKAMGMKKFNYLLVDLNPQTDNQYRLRTNIIPNEVIADGVVVFTPK